MFDLVVRGGTVANGDAVFRSDVGVSGGKIVALGIGLEGHTEVDASNKLVLPAGVDMHVHFTAADHRPNAHPRLDDFESGSSAAAAGGVGTVGDIAFPRRGERLPALVERVRSEAEARSVVDFVLHAALIDPDDDTEADLAKLAAMGYASIKLLMIDPRFDLLSDAFVRAMSSAGALGLVCMVHCEELAVIQFLTASALKSGSVEIGGYGRVRPVYAEAVAVARAIAYARAAGAILYIVHVSSEAVLSTARIARAQGQRIYLETRPLYLFFTDEDLQRPDGGLLVGNPPPRTMGDVDSIWAAIAAGDVDTLASDHLPWRRSEKLDPDADVTRARAGVPDIETMLPLLFSEGVRTGRISLERFIQVTATDPARIFGIHPRKGAICVGADADLAVWDPTLTKRIRARRLHGGADYSQYEGREVTGWPVTTVSRGEVIYADGEVCGRPGRGRWIQRSMASEP